jgi:hypothetical protein
MLANARWIGEKAVDGNERRNSRKDREQHIERHPTAMEMTRCSGML